MPEHLRHDTRNLKVKIVPLFSHGEGETMVPCFLPYVPFISLPMVILYFEQYEKESIGAAWARVSALIHADLDLSLPDSILL